MTICNLERLNEKIKTFYALGATEVKRKPEPSSVSKTTAIQTEFSKKMKALGATVITDDLNNVYATLQGAENLPVIMTGSCLDPADSDNKDDGIIGVATAMEIAQTIVEGKIYHRHPITVALWINDEGRIHPTDTAAIIELHMETTPVLETSSFDIGVVEGICGKITYEFLISGRSGEVSLDCEADVNSAATSMIRYLQDELDELDNQLRYKVSTYTCFSDSPHRGSNEVKFTLDVEHQDSDIIRSILSVIKKIPEEVENCKTSYSKVLSQSTVSFSPEMIECIELSAKELKYTSRRFYGGNGSGRRFIHDRIPAAMIYIPRIGKQNHCELEYKFVENCIKGANVLLLTLLHIDMQ